MGECLSGYLYSQVYIYHHTKHGGLKNRYPIDVWQSAFNDDGRVIPPLLPVDPSTFFIPFLWNKPTTIHPEGIFLERNWYRSEELRPWVGARVTTYYNKSNPNACYPEIERDRFLAIPQEDAIDWASSTWSEKFSRMHPIAEPDHHGHLAARVAGRKYQSGLATNAADATLRARLLPSPSRAMTSVRDVSQLPRCIITNPITERLED